MKQISRFFLLATFVTFSGTAKVSAEDLETKVKAAYIFNFTKFVEWNDFSGKALNICVLGERAIAEILNALASRNASKQITVEQGQIADLTQCQLLYIDHSENMLFELVAKVRGADVLTVSDAKDFAKNGGIIGFYIDEGKVKLEINQQIAEASNLKISSKLMEVARIVP